MATIISGLLACSPGLAESFVEISPSGQIAPSKTLNEAPRTETHAPENPTPGPPADAKTQSPEARTDYATKRAELLNSRQPTDGDAPNHWTFYADLVARVSGAWAYFHATNPAIWQYIDEDPGNRRTGQPQEILANTDASTLVPELRRFLETMDQLRIPNGLDALTEPCRFICPRTTDRLLSEFAPEFGQTRLFVTLWNARMRFALEDGDIERFDQSLRHSLAVARAVAGRGSVLSGMVSVSARHVVLMELQRGLLAGRMTETSPLVALRALNEQPNSLDPSLVFDCERLVVLDSIEKFFSDVKRTTGGPEALGNAVDAGLGVLTPKQEQMQIANRYFDAAISLFSADPETRTRAQADIDEITRLVQDDDRSPSFEPLSTALPSINKQKEMFRRDTAIESGVRLMLALEAYRSREGRYPAGLQDLVPRDLDRVPRDPYTTESPMSYRRILEEGGGAADGYVLYTVGSDGKDNGGQPHPNNPVNALGPGAISRGYDYIFNQPEPR